MYGIDGRHALPEETLPHLEGYRGSRPVRIGNAAYTQLQLDIYGELMDAVYLYDKYGEPISHDSGRTSCASSTGCAHNWRQPDEGIWEVRGGRAGVPLLARDVLGRDRPRRSAWRASARSRPAGALARRARRRSTTTSSTHFWDAEREAFVQHAGRDTLDASSLLMPLVRFIAPDRPALAVDAARHRGRELVQRLAGLSLPARRTASDGLTGEEGTFSHVLVLVRRVPVARSGDLQKARFFFEKMLGYANHLGLYAEELGPAGEHLGNFPQAFTHLALISAAFDLDRRLSAAGFAG